MCETKGGEAHCCSDEGSPTCVREKAALRAEGLGSGRRVRVVHRVKERRMGDYTKQTAIIR